MHSLAMNSRIGSLCQRPVAGERELDGNTVTVARTAAAYWTESGESCQRHLLLRLPVFSVAVRLVEQRLLHVTVAQARSLEGMQVLAPMLAGSCDGDRH